MAYRFEVGEPVRDAVCRVVTEEVAAAEDSLALVLATGSSAAVHDVRKRTKKLRAVATMVSGSVPRRCWRGVHRAAGDAARALATAREAHVLHHTLAGVVAEAGGGFAMAMASAARAERDAVSVPDDEAVQHASWLLTGVVTEVGTWSLPDRFDTIADGVAATYRDGRRRWRALGEPVAIADAANVEAVHRWRRSVKHRWYHTRLLACLAPDVLGAEEVLLGELGELLGADHDLALLIEALADDPGRWGGVTDAARIARRATARRRHGSERAAVLAGQLFVDPPATHVGRLGAWWESYHAT
jgi:hypothetical protein